MFVSLLDRFTEFSAFFGLLSLLPAMLGTSRGTTEGTSDSPEIEPNLDEDRFFQPTAQEKENEDPQFYGPLRLDPDMELVKAVAAGEVAAYRGLVERYQGRIYSVCYGMVRNSEDARDLAQEAFIKAFRNIDKFRFGSSFYTWLCRIAMNVSIDHLRRMKIRRADAFDEGLAARDNGGGISNIHNKHNPGKDLERKGLRERISEAIDALPPDQRQVIVLREIEGLSYKEIADIMGIPEGTVMSRLFYARKKLQNALKDQHE
jgi:RNA polymerase sigma-70 factor (ECF subfamily)